MPFLLKMSDRRLAAAFFRASPPKLPPLAAPKIFAFMAICGFATGCTTRQAIKPDLSTQIPAPVASISSGPLTPPAAISPTPRRETKLPPPPAPSRPTPSSRAAEVAEKLDSAFLVASTEPDLLIVSKKTAPPERNPSLFEQSILLGQIRGTLTSTAPRSAHLAASASLKRGVATVAIDPSTTPGTAAVAIAKILALDGVHSVRADFQSAAE